MTKQNKSPWLAAILNLLFNGVGYIYNGKRIIFGILILVPYLLSHVVDGSQILANMSPETTAIAVLSLIMTSSAFAYDAFQEAKKINEKN
jgi:hypothetical protein